MDFFFFGENDNLSCFKFIVERKWKWMYDDKVTMFNAYN